MAFVTSRRGLTQILALGALASLAWLMVIAWQGQRAQAYNDAIARASWSQAATYGGLHGTFAQAYESQSNGKTEAALEYYARVERGDEPRLAQDATFNMGNIYLRLAFAKAGQEQNDLALPLAELAKQSYRRVLAGQPSHWDAKYNLERALQLFPDPRETAIQEWMAPERSQRSIVTFEADEQLP